MQIAFNRLINWFCAKNLEALWGYGRTRPKAGRVLLAPIETKFS